MSSKCLQNKYERAKIFIASKYCAAKKRFESISRSTIFSIALIILLAITVISGSASSEVILKFWPLCHDAINGQCFNTLSEITSLIANDKVMKLFITTLGLLLLLVFLRERALKDHTRSNTYPCLSTREHIYQFLKRIYSSILLFYKRNVITPTAALLLTILIIIISLIGGAYPEEIKNSVPLSTIRKYFTGNEIYSGNTKEESPILVEEIKSETIKLPTVSAPAGTLYVLILVFALLFYSREKEVARLANQKEREFYLKVRTLPSSDILEPFEAAYKDILNVTDQILYGNIAPKDKREKIKNAIINCLDGISVLARDLRRAPVKSRFAVNFMRYISIEDILSEDSDDIIKSLTQFWDRESFDGLRGILYLTKELSTSTATKEKLGIDDKLPDMLILPVPEPAWSINDKNQPKFLPGAVTALEEGHYIIDDTLDIFSAYKRGEYNEIPRTVFVNIDDYFRNTPAGQQARSFLSLRVDGKGSQPLGVVNVHCDQPNIFEAEWVFKTYRMLISPILQQIALLILEGQKPTSN